MLRIISSCLPLSSTVWFVYTQYEHCTQWRHIESTYMSEIQLVQSVRIYLKNIPAKCHPNPILNDKS